MNIGSLIARHGRYRPQHTAVVFGDERLAYADLNRRVNRLANALCDHGIEKGDKVATLLPNCLELLSLYWAVAKIGAVAVPMSPLLQPAGLASLLNDSDAVLVLAAPPYTDTLDAARGELGGIREDGFVLLGAPREGYQTLDEFIAEAGEDEPPDAAVTGDDVFNIFYTSGTTGQPKGIVHTHFIRAMYATLFANAWRMTPESVLLQTGAIIFNGAFVTMMPCFAQGATCILHKMFDPGAVIETIAAERVTHMMMVPSQIVAVMSHPEFAPEKLASLEMILSLGAPLHLEHKRALEAVLSGRFHELYGLTEGFVTILDKTDFPGKPESVGAPPPFFEMRIVGADGENLAPGEIGEIVGRGPILMPGYYKRADLTGEAIRDGWLFSGDLGYVDEDGFLYLVDRKKDMIISGGVNVYPRDIEEVAVAHAAVQEVAVFGVPDPKWGETPVAAVVLKPGREVSSESLREWINARVGAKFQRVSRVEVLDGFPRNAAGKILKRDLRERFGT